MHAPDLLDWMICLPIATYLWYRIILAELRAPQEVTREKLRWCLAFLAGLGAFTGAYGDYGVDALGLWLAVLVAGLPALALAVLRDPDAPAWPGDLLDRA